MNAIGYMSTSSLECVGMSNEGKFTLQGTNCYIVGTGRQRILIDTGEGKPEFTQLLKGVLNERGIEIVDVLITHWHPDHVGGVGSVVELGCGCGATHSSQQQSIDALASNDTDKPRVWKCDRREIESGTIERQDRSLSKHNQHSLRHIPDGHIFSVEGATLRAMYTPGHASDHMCFWLEEEQAMFTGDNILGHGTTVFSDLGVYLNSLRLMLGAKPGVLYPGHGDVVANGCKLIQSYIDHRLERDNQIIDILENGSSKDVSVQAPSSLGWSSSDITRIMYGSIPGFPSNLLIAAEDNVLKHIHKLFREGRVRPASLTTVPDDTAATMPAPKIPLTSTPAELRSVRWLISAKM
ncbi:Metallo-hydrolase/oxidoreductase [Ramicandelaber brevisporus]|nr:Metallo-hydrolase/oxidoreductase [Ramicandelaber brevisporus]